MNYQFEILKLLELDEELLTPYGSFTYKVVLQNKDILGYWTATFGATDDSNHIRRQVEAVEVAFESYASKTSIALCLSNEESFHWDQENQALYIHYDHSINPFSVLTEYSNTLGFTDRSVEYINDVPYKPLLISVPAISQSADPLQYGIIAYSDATFELVNDIGEFDTDPLLVGMTCRLKRDGVVKWEGRVEGYSTTLENFTVRTTDKRKQLETDWPTATMDVLSNYDSGWETGEKLIPDGYGTVIQVPAYPIADGAGTITFRWAVEATSITQVYTEVDDVAIAVSHAGFSSGGTFTLADAVCATDESNPTNGIKKIYVTGVMRSDANPADIIADLNSDVLGISYDSDNYDTIEWAAEKAFLDDVSLYMDKTQKLIEWIELLQNGSNYGFRYEDIEERTIRLDRSRTSVATISNVEIREIGEVDNNAELFATDALVKYSKNWRTDEYAQVTNDDYYTTSYQEHRLPKTYEIETLLINSTDAAERAERIIADVYTTKPIFTVVIDYSSYENPRIYDIINIELSFLNRDFYGWQECQVIGISPNIDTDEWELTLRSV